MANQSQGIIGTWDSPQGFQLIVSKSGNVRILDIDLNQEMVGVGTYSFKGDQLLLDSNLCQKWETGFLIEFSCQATYSSYVIKDGDEVVGIRFEEISDPFRDRRRALTGAPWQRAEE